MDLSVIRSVAVHDVMQFWSDIWKHQLIPPSRIHVENISKGVTMDSFR